jgi:hypothetical protein
MVFHWIFPRWLFSFEGGPIRDVPGERLGLERQNGPVPGLGCLAPGCPGTRSGSRIRLSLVNALEFLSHQRLIRRLGIAHPTE